MKKNPDHTPAPPREVPVLALKVPDAAKAIGISVSIIPMDELKRYLASLVA